MLGADIDRRLADIVRAVLKGMVEGCDRVERADAGIPFEQQAGAIGLERPLADRRLRCFMGAVTDRNYDPVILRQLDPEWGEVGKGIDSVRRVGVRV